jgi:hypothetical protein
MELLENLRIARMYVHVILEDESEGRMVWWKRYEGLLERKPVPAKEVLKDFLAKELVEICEAFPPAKEDVAFEIESQRVRFADKLEHMPKVSLAMAELLAKIVTLELEREHDAVAHLFRNGEHKESCAAPYAEDALMFLWPLVVDVLLQRKEEAQNALSRRDLIDIVERFRSQFRSRRMLLM